jgi:hypothetical protein
MTQYFNLHSMSASVACELWGQHVPGSMESMSFDIARVDVAQEPATLIDAAVQNDEQSKSGRKYLMFGSRDLALSQARQMSERLQSQEYIQRRGDPNRDGHAGCGVLGVCEQDQSVDLCRRVEVHDSFIEQRVRRVE